MCTDVEAHYTWPVFVGESNTADRGTGGNTRGGGGETRGGGSGMVRGGGGGLARGSGGRPHHLAAQDEQICRRELAEQLVPRFKQHYMWSKSDGSNQADAI